MISAAARAAMAAVNTVRQQCPAMSIESQQSGSEATTEAEVDLTSTGLSPSPSFPLSLILMG